MKKMLLLLLAVTSSSFSLSFSNYFQEKEIYLKQLMAKIITFISEKNTSSQVSTEADDIQNMLGQVALKQDLIHKVVTTLQCADKYHIEHNNMLTIIDYSLPSSEKRLWVFDLKDKKLLFHTYVSHGITSGSLLTTRFSNKYDSKASSIGVYKTEKAYYGREGLSLQLEGLDQGFNNNASGRSVVMHGGWYVNEDFIKKYGRSGRSWGCPAVPKELSTSIINVIKDRSLFVIYYPDDYWFLKSRFLNCFSPKTVSTFTADVKPPLEEREAILFADIHKNNKYQENAPILVMPAESYKRLFQLAAPLERMLRRQINHEEYVALTKAELKKMISDDERVNDALQEVFFVIPVIKMKGGYYETEMKIVDFGKIKQVKFNSAEQDEIKDYTVYFESRPVITLKTTNRFIRWLGL